MISLIRHPFRWLAHKLVAAVVAAATSAAWLPWLLLWARKEGLA